MGSSDNYGNGNGNGNGKGKEKEKDISVYDFEFDDADSSETSCKNFPNQRPILNRDFFRKMCARSSLFAATNPQASEYYNVLRANDWAVCPYFSGECQPSNVAADAHNLKVATKVWEKTLECVGLPLNAVDKLVHGENVPCKFNITIVNGKMFKRTGAVALSSRTVRCVGSVEGFALQKTDLEVVIKLFSRMLRSPRVQGAIRYESPY